MLWRSASKLLIIFAALFFLGAIFAVFLFQDKLARVAWQKYGRPNLALAFVNTDAEFAMLLGSYYFGQTIGKSEYDLIKAEKAYTKALKAEPGILWGHYQLARIYFAKGDFARALEEINKELEFNPANLRSLYVRGLIYGYRGYPGDLANAEDDFKRFTLWAPKEWAGYNDLAWILAKQGKHQEAKETILKAFEVISDARENPWLLNALGVAELNLSEYAEATLTFKSAKEFAENLTIQQWNFSYPGNDPAQAEEGLEAFRKAIGENLRRALVKSEAL